MKKQPLRMCIECHRSLPKRELVRIVRGSDGAVCIDQTGKVPGRGAYLCQNRQCWLEALAHKHIGRALKVELTAEDHARIEAYASRLSSQAPES